MIEKLASYLRLQPIDVWVLIGAVILIVLCAVVGISADLKESKRKDEQYSESKKKK